MKGYPVTMGLEKLKERSKTKPTPMDCAIVIALRRAGAVPFCKTTMSQLGNTWGGGSPAYGDTLNPWDTLRTTGGSSCGEGALVGGGGSPFGIGSDVGGSVRIPAAFCGICSLKPTAQRLTFAWEDGRTIMNHPGDYGIPATAGPMARSVEDLVEALAALWTEPLFQVDSRVPPMPLRREVLEDSRPLRVGWYIEEFTYPRACAAAVRAVEMTKAALEGAGHTLVPFRGNSESVILLKDIIGCDYGLHALDNSAGNSKRKELKPQESDGNVGSYGGGPLKGERLHPDLVASYSPPPPLAKDSRGTPVKRANTPAAYQQMVDWRDKLRDKFAQYWTCLGVDVVLSPAWPFPALPVEEVRNAHYGGVCAARIYNFMDYPAGVLPVTKVSAEDLASPYEPRTDDELMARAASAAVAGSQGLPVAVQLAAPPWREELLLRAMLEVQRLLPFNPDQHRDLRPVPRRSPELGARPERLPEVASKL